MTQFNNSTFSVAGKHCNGCAQRDAWLAQKGERIKALKLALLEIGEGPWGEAEMRNIANKALFG